MCRHFAFVRDVCDRVNRPRHSFTVHEATECWPHSPTVWLSVSWGSFRVRIAVCGLARMEKDACVGSSGYIRRWPFCMHCGAEVV